MGVRRNFRLIFILICSIVAFMVYYSNCGLEQTFKFTHILDLSRILTKNAYVADLATGYSIFGPQCRMLDPNPWNDSIQKYLIEPRPLICSRLPLLTYIDQLTNSSNVLKIDKKVLNRYKVRGNHIITCCYRIITRIEQNLEEYNMSADSLYELSNCTNFVDQVLLANETEFIVVNCRSYPKGKNEGKLVYKNVHPVVPILENVNMKIKNAKKKKSDWEKLNVVILGIDSVSKLNLRRIMPRTLKFLQENNWIELKGYNKIGENTFPNLMAILSGRPMRELEDMCWANHSQKMDDCPAIWKEYNAQGYVTLYAEDTPTISTFNLLRTGFVKKPTDYYMRPFMLAAHDLLHLKNLSGLPVCLGPVLIVDHILDYAKRFFRVFNNHNYFSLLWMNSLSHNDVNTPRALDISVHRFLNELFSIGTYNNSLVLLLSDHGVRFGNIRETFLGYLEERLPFMFIWYPDWFREKYPDKYNNLVVNQNRLTSPYDVYVTLKRHLMGETKNEDSPTEPISRACPKCNGLLEVQPVDRTCADASIDINWCLCSDYRGLSVKEETAVRIAKFLYGYIVDQTNSLIQSEKVKSSLCSKWKFLRVFSVEEIILPNTSVQFSLRNVSNMEIFRYDDLKLGADTKIYVIIIELNPGRTKFEATVQMQTSASGNKHSFAFLEPPKRLDSIYKTSKCVKALLLKHYCYCVRR